MKFTNLERLLPFGYLTLVILGIVKESVLYYQLGVNILKYSTLMDILISPIADLTAYPVILLILIVYILLIYIGLIYASKNLDKKWARKVIFQKNTNENLSAEDLKIHLGGRFISIIAFVIVCFFLGIGVGSGKKISDRIENNQLNHKHFLTFNTDETKEIYLVGSNSVYYFYVEKGSKNVKISPIGAVKSIEFLKKDANKSNK